MTHNKRQGVIIPPGKYSTIFVTSGVTLTLHLWVSPVELLTFSALFTSKAWTTAALACEL